MGSGSGGFLLFLFFLGDALGVGQHELDAVFLVAETASNIVSLLKDITKQGTAVVMTTHNIPMLDKFPGIVYRCKEGVLYDVTNEYNRIDLTEDGEDN